MFLLAFKEARFLAQKSCFKAKSRSLTFKKIDVFYCVCEHSSFSFYFVHIFRFFFWFAQRAPI